MDNGYAAYLERLNFLRKSCPANVWWLLFDPDSAVSRQPPVQNIYYLRSPVEQYINLYKSLCLNCNIYDHQAEIKFAKHQLFCIRLDPYLLFADCITA